MTGSKKSEKNMIAVVKEGPGSENVVVSTVPVPIPSSGFARVKVFAAGICGTDIHIARDEYAHEAPVVMGHEIVGTVDMVGDPAHNSLLDQRVVCETYFSTCQVCEYCRSGRPNLCPKRRSLGSYENGGFAKFVVMPIHNLHPIPDWLDDMDAVLAEPLACVTNCLLDPPVINAGDKVLVTGPGAIGHLAAQVARAEGGVVTLSGLNKDAERLAIARELGLGTTTTIPEAGAFDVVIECSGSAPGAAVALNAARRAGRYIQVGIFGHDVVLPFDQILYKELEVSSGFASTPQSWLRALALIENKLLNLRPLVTLRLPIAKWDEAFAAASEGQGLKTVIHP